MVVETKIVGFLDLIRNFKVNLAENNINESKASIITEVIVASILRKVHEFGSSKDVVKNLENSLKSEISWKKHKLTLIEKLLIDIFFINPQAPCVLKINSLGEILNDSGDCALILIDLQKLLHQIFPNFQFSFSFSSMEQINSKEKDLISMIRDKENRQINIYKNNSNRLNKAEVVKQISKNESLFNLIGEHPFQNIEIKQENSNTTHIYQTIKIKL